MPKRTSERGVHFYRDLPSGRAGVRVDASAHTIRLHDEVTGEVTELGALRTSLVSAMCLIGKALSVDAYERDLSPIGEAIVAALQRAAGGVRDATLEAAIAEVNTTPLLYAAPFLDARWLWADAFRFRACRVAIANAEDLVIDQDSTAAAIDVVTRLGKWRELFLHPDGGKKAINSALNDFGETMPATALWGLRNVALRRPRAARAPLEVLGWLGSLHDTPPAVVALVEGAADDEIAALLDAPATSTPRALAQLLAQGDASSRTLLQLVRSAEQGQASIDDVATPGFARPPIALPDAPGLRFIDNARALVEEGAAMHHCVAGLRWSCNAGDAYVFHAERDGTHGTIHVDSSGRVVEARGPFNRASIAASWGAAQLSAWGAGLWVEEFAPAQLAWPPGLHAPSGARPLRSVRAIVELFDAMAARAPQRRGELARWFRAATRGAVAGKLGVFVVDTAGAAHADPTHADTVPATAWTIDVCGVVVSTDDAWPREARPPVRGLELPPHAAPLRAPRLRAPPIAPPRFMGIELIAPDDVVRASAEFRRALRVEEERWYFRCHDDAGTALIGVDVQGVATVIASHVVPSVAETWRARIATWAHGFWGPRMGMERSTWDSLRAPALPPGGEALTTVAACHLVYASTCERRSDVDGALARFYERHVAAALRGHAFLVARERAMGFVIVLDAKRKIVARSEDILTPVTRVALVAPVPRVAPVAPPVRVT